MKYTFDFGGSSIKGIKFNDKSIKINTYHIKYTEHVNSLNVDINHAFSLIKELIIQENENSVEIGISFPGIIDKENQKIMSDSAFVNAKNFDVNGYFKDLTNVKKVIINNDGKSALLGEYAYGKNKKNDNVLLLTLGTAIGGACIINKKIVYGHDWYAGEYSKIFSDLSNKESKDQAAMFCGTLQACYRYSIATKMDLQQVNGIFLAEKWEENDPVVCDIFDAWLTSVAKLIININLIICANDVYIGGGISENQKFISELNKKIILLSKEIKINTPMTKSCSLKNEAGCYGALALLNGEEY